MRLLAARRAIGSGLTVTACVALVAALALAICLTGARMAVVIMRAMATTHATTRSRLPRAGLLAARILAGRRARSASRTAAAVGATHQLLELDLRQHTLPDQVFVDLVVGHRHALGQRLAHAVLHQQPHRTREAGGDPGLHQQPRIDLRAKHVVGDNVVGVLEPLDANLQVVQFPAGLVVHRLAEAQGEDLLLDHLVGHQTQGTQLAAAARSTDLVQRRAPAAPRRSHPALLFPGEGAHGIHGHLTVSDGGGTIRGAGETLLDHRDQLRHAGVHRIDEHLTRLARDATLGAGR
ncbi:MAG: hypothetical protein R3E70_15850 [Burkholderiaceae bacterium]